MAFIFRQSALPAAASSRESDPIAGLLAGILSVNGETASFIVRKTAHFLEYILLGCSLAVTVNDLAAGNDFAVTVNDPAAGNDLPSGNDSAVTVNDLAAGNDLSSAKVSAAANAVISAKFFFLSWLIGAVYAVSDEAHQYFVPGRACELRDMIIDACGAAVGVLLVFLFIEVRKQK